MAILTTTQAEFLTPRQVALARVLSRRTVYRLIATGQLPAERWGGQWRIPRSALDAQECRL